MATSYSGDPSTSDRDEVRFLIGDTGGSEAGESSEFFLSDEEIDYVLSTHSNVKVAALQATKGLIKRLAREADASSSDSSVDFSQRIQHFRENRKQLEREVAITAATPYAGGISEDDKQIDEDDEDRVDPAFKRAVHDNTRAGQQQGS